MNRIRIVANKEHVDGLVTDADSGKPLPARAAVLRMAVGHVPVAELEVFVTEVDVTVNADEVKWLGLDRVPLAALRAELARREAHPPEVTG
ncbi:hypothetical protein Lesp02_84180 [Lentzea sp. NBRC 105346]|uniref:hypothetical protein n=1 Tax=Lentzea sp. NBRC 105346 TaxID=3032205 RepID=UPI0024A2461C|nr:hypothetical protein [Lentzea sp. NBRC 105346]GLZ36231.1 hypothetical protein Lesp02_84180 [Lentzea sp. NBRC 105346]